MIDKPMDKPFLENASISPSGCTVAAGITMDSRNNPGNSKDREYSLKSGGTPRSKCWRNVSDVIQSLDSEFRVVLSRRDRNTPSKVNWNWFLFSYERPRLWASVESIYWKVQFWLSTFCIRCYHASKKCNWWLGKNPGKILPIWNTAPSRAHLLPCNKNVRRITNSPSIGSMLRSVTSKLLQFL